MEKSKTYFEKGIEYLEKKDYDKAIEFFTKAIEINENYAPAYNNRGNAYTDKSELIPDRNEKIKLLEKAIQDHSKAIEIDENFAKAYNGRGNAYIFKSRLILDINEKIKFLEKATRDYNKAIEIDEDYTSAYSNRGNAYSDKSELIPDINEKIRLLEKAIQDHSKAIEINENYAPAYNNRGNAYMDKSKLIPDINEKIRLLEKAIQDHSKAIEINENYAYAYNGRGVAYIDKSRLIPDINEKIRLIKHAIRDYTKAIELNDYSAFFNLSLICIHDIYKNQSKFSNNTIIYFKKIFSCYDFLEASFENFIKYVEYEHDRTRIFDFIKIYILLIKQYVDENIIINPVPFEYAYNIFERYVKNNEEVIFELFVFHSISDIIEKFKEILNIFFYLYKQNFHIINRNFIEKFAELIEFFKNRIPELNNSEESQKFSIANLIEIALNNDIDLLDFIYLRYANNEDYFYLYDIFVCIIISDKDISPKIPVDLKFKYISLYKNHISTIDELINFIDYYCAIANEIVESRNFELISNYFEQTKELLKEIYNTLKNNENLKDDTNLRVCVNTLCEVAGTLLCVLQEDALKFSELVTDISIYFNDNSINRNFIHATKNKKILKEIEKHKKEYFNQIIISIYNIGVKQGIKNIKNVLTRFEHEIKEAEEELADAPIEVIQSYFYDKFKLTLKSIKNQYYEDKIEEIVIGFMNIIFNILAEKIKKEEITLKVNISLLKNEFSKNILNLLFKTIHYLKSNKADDYGMVVLNIARIIEMEFTETFLKPIKNQLKTKKIEPDKLKEYIDKKIYNYIFQNLLFFGLITHLWRNLTVSKKIKGELIKQSVNILKSLIKNHQIGSKSIYEKLNEINEARNSVAHFKEDKPVIDEKYCDKILSFFMNGKDGLFDVYLDYLKNEGG